MLEIEEEVEQEEENDSKGSSQLQNIDDELKDAEEPREADGDDPVPQNTRETHFDADSPKISDLSVKVGNRIGGNIAAKMKPSTFLNEHQRTFSNPISYLGGPHLRARNRWSAESIVSLD